MITFHVTPRINNSGDSHGMRYCCSGIAIDQFFQLYGASYHVTRLVYRNDGLSLQNTADRKTAVSRHRNGYFVRCARKPPVQNITKVRKQRVVHLDIAVWTVHEPFALTRL